jgi:hypothetical protein
MSRMIAIRGREARRPAAAESSAAAATPGSTLQSAGLLGCREQRRNERLGAMHAASPLVPKAPKSDVEITVVDHGAGGERCAQS